ncbi:MAG: 50S ribosomal protein L21 [candidate division Zixibacteria bacterium]|jgi:large subunit ribosomal protein L21|nr:50S ribosomal protein L21 [candidate division Zixibacteria bacterium]
MFAVFESGGLQFNAELGAILKVPYLSIKPGEMVSIERVLLVKQGENALIGTPYLNSARVEAEVISEGQAEKVEIYKFKKRTKYRKHLGHRQKYSEIKIMKIVAPEN